MRFFILGLEAVFGGKNLVSRSKLKLWNAIMGECCLKY